MSDLAEFLLARIAEDEQVARAASPSPWSFPGIDSVTGGTLYDETRRIVDVVYEHPEDHDGTIVRHVLVPEADANGTHIARHDPARILAECEAKRRIVELHTNLERGGLGDEGDDYRIPTPFCTCCKERWPCETLLLLALPYADRPGYRAEWRP